MIDQTQYRSIIGSFHPPGRKAPSIQLAPDYPKFKIKMDLKLVSCLLISLLLSTIYVEILPNGSLYSCLWRARTPLPSGCTPPPLGPSPAPCLSSAECCDIESQYCEYKEAIVNDVVCTYTFQIDCKKEKRGDGGYNKEMIGLSQMRESSVELGLAVPLVDVMRGQQVPHQPRRLGVDIAVILVESVNMLSSSNFGCNIAQCTVWFH